MVTLTDELVLQAIPSSILMQTPPTIAPIGVSQFAESGNDSQLNHTFIAHHEEAQSLFDAFDIGWGTQYELARGVSNGDWRWADVIEYLPLLEGPDSIVAPKVQTIFRPSSPTQNSTNWSYDPLWKELDREQAAIMENCGRGLGLMGEWMGVPDWYGGKIQQVARLTQAGADNGFKIILEKMESRRSHRFARYYGSRRFLQVHVPQMMLQDEEVFRKVQVFFQQKFVLCGRVYVPFHAKRGNVYMVETNENYERGPRENCGDELRLSFASFIRFHNPLEENFNQASRTHGMGKYMTRFALGLSNTAPALEFNLEHIYFMDDIAASDWPRGSGKPPTDKLMTDGCGFMNHAALATIFRRFNYETIPAGVQGRIDGSKGFWILYDDPSDTSVFPKIWIRDSQKKIANRLFDRVHRIFDLLAPARPSPSYRLSPQIVTNLFFNKVPKETLIKLMEQTLEDRVAPLLDWDSPNAMVYLADAISKAGNISGTRSQRNAPSQNRILGLKGNDWGAIESHPDDSTSDEASAVAVSGRNMYSGAPISLHEAALELLQAGFHPATNKMLNDKIEHVVTKVMENTIARCDIPIEESIYSFIVPDPLGILEEGEISYRFSQPRKDRKTSFLIDSIPEGKVVLGRFPIRLPSDMQKVTAVDKPELHKWRDVVVISTKGKRSIANLLAGGDMDGDEVVAIWDSAIVDAFPDENLLTPPPGDLEKSISPGSVNTVKAFCEGAELLDRRHQCETFLKYLLADLADSGKGLYSKMHDEAVVRYGYDDKRTIRLAYIFAILLDASKTGARLRPGVQDRDRRNIFSSPVQLGEPASSRWTARPVPNIVDILKNAGNQKKAQLMARYKKVDDVLDPHLAKPFQDAECHAELCATQYGMAGFQEELRQIEAHVKSVKREWSSSWLSFFRTQKAGGKPTKTGDEITLRCAKKYAEPVDGLRLIVGEEQNRIKASCLYIIRQEESVRLKEDETLVGKQDKTLMAFKIAFRDLCDIKAMASSGGRAPITRIFDEAKTFSSSYLRSLRRKDDSAGPEGDADEGAYFVGA